ncbi:MAG: prenyltransferase/squalene oxidase repeat-containing protein [Candidatus Cybelea sp.]
MKERWLASMQSPSGAWTDFWTPSGSSSEWVTAYVGAALASSADVVCRDAARAAWQYLVRVTHEEGGWGYGPAVPCDGDTTAWALILAQRIGEERSATAARARRFLESLRVDGGVATYGEERAIRSYVGAPDSADFSGWLQPHACVTGVAAQVSPLNGELSDDLLAMQQPDGSWQSYWWFEDAYATAMSVVALVPARSARVRTALGSAVAWARRRLSDENPSPFTLALLLTILSRTNADGTDARRCADALARCRMRDGYWRGSAQLRIPAPGTADPASVTSWNRWWGSGSPFNVFSVDHRSIFTTATAQHALAA